MICVNVELLFVLLSLSSLQFLCAFLYQRKLPSGVGSVYCISVEPCGNKLIHLLHTVIFFDHFLNFRTFLKVADVTQIPARKVLVYIFLYACQVVAK